MVKVPIIIKDDITEDTTGNIVVLKFMTTNKQLFETPDFNEFKEVLFGHIIGRDVYDINEILKSPYNDIRTITNQIEFMNANLGADEFELVEVKRINKPATNVDYIEKSFYNEHTGMSMLFFIQDSKSKISYTMKRAIFNKLAKHIIKNRPLVVKEGDLPEIIVKTEQDSKGNGYREFLHKAVLYEQKLNEEGYDDTTIGELLESNGLHIIDFNYIAA